jgi:hypothetical protein
MRLLNANARAVMMEIDTQKSVAPGDDACWCSLCEADVKALALSKLTPCYCTTFDYAPILMTEDHLMIRRAVSHAIKRVALHPKHDRASAAPPPGGPRVVDFIFQEGLNLVDKVMEESGSRCACDHCRQDALAHSLNRYPPRYGVRRNGEASLPEKERTAIRIEFGAIMARAVRMVSDKPRH